MPTTESGAPAADNQNSATAGAGGPVLTQAQHLPEKPARVNRERIPDRVLHARGSAAAGYVEVTADVTPSTPPAFRSQRGPHTPRRMCFPTRAPPRGGTAWRCAQCLSDVARRTRTLSRCSTVAGSLGTADAEPAPCVFAVKFYTAAGNDDLVGNNPPVCVGGDPVKFPDFIHSQKRDPFTGRQEPDNVRDFWPHSPEATHQVTWLMGDRGIPASSRPMPAYGPHPYQWPNPEGEAFFVKYHLQTTHGVRPPDAGRAADLAA
ncbi:catalase, partial [Burkholderia sp. Ax-1735]|nr:catalase [Burkholderia sp. Ax-1735]